MILITISIVKFIASLSNIFCARAISKNYEASENIAHARNHVTPCAHPSQNNEARVLTSTKLVIVAKHVNCVNRIDELTQLITFAHKQRKDSQTRTP